MPGGFSICLLYRFGEYTAEDVTRFVELGKLTPEQYEGITGEKYDASVVEQQEKVQLASCSDFGSGRWGMYLVPVQYEWKRLTLAEAEAITVAGMQIVSVFQRGTNDAAGGAINGRRDGKAAAFQIL